MTELYVEFLPHNALLKINGSVQSNPCRQNVTSEYIDVHVSVAVPPSGKLRNPLELMNAVTTVYANQQNIIKCKGICHFCVPLPETGMLYVNGKQYHGEVINLIPLLPEHEYVEVKMLVAGEEIYKVHYTTVNGDFSPTLPRVETVYLRLKGVPSDCVVLLNEQRVMPYSSFPMVIEDKTRFSLLVRNADRIELDHDVKLDAKFSLDMDIGATIAERRAASAPDESMNVFGDVFAVVRIPLISFAACVAFFWVLSALIKSTVVAMIGIPVSIFVVVYAVYYARTKH